MKTIKTNNFVNKKADLIEHPPIDGETDDSMVLKKKKKKNIYQLGREVITTE